MGRLPFRYSNELVAMNAKEALGPWLKRYWGLEIVMSDSHTVQLSDAQSKALLTELIRFVERLSEEYVSDLSPYGHELELDRRFIFDARALLAKAKDAK